MAMLRNTFYSRDKFKFVAAFLNQYFVVFLIKTTISCIFQKNFIKVTIKLKKIYEFFKKISENT